MKLRYLQSVALLAWGFQTDLLLFAFPMAIIWEGQFFFNRRWTLTKQDFYRTSDLSSVAFIFMFIFLVLNRADYPVILTLISWLPILFFPLTIVIAYSTTEKMTLDIFFRSLRKQKQEVTQSWDMDYVLFTLCLMAAGTNKEDGGLYFPFVCLLIALALFRLRSARYKITLWSLVLGFAFLAAFAAQKGIRESHIELKQQVQVWLNSWIERRNNPAKTFTAIGSVGQLKVSDKILFRIKSPSDKAVPRLLQEASYDLPSGKDWGLMDQAFTKVEHLEDFSWQLNTSDDADTTLDIYLPFLRERAIIPLPPGTTQLIDLSALNIRRNHYGTIQGMGLVPTPMYSIKVQPGGNLNNPPSAIDTFVPEQYSQLMTSLVKDNQLDASHPLASLADYFKDFRYSLYQHEAASANPIAHFLQDSKAGHCEYFASSTVLILRALGIPARYVVGYSVQEYNDLLDMYVVRQRHAHAWAIAYINGRWQTVDTTPGIWLESETAQSFFAQPLIDLLANANFMFQLWWNDQRIEDYEDYLYIIGAILSLILLWRIMRGEKVRINEEKDELATEEVTINGAESPFFKLEQLLLDAGYSRGTGETLDPWLSRIGFQDLKVLLKLHNQWRFDPMGLDQAQKKLLTQAVRDEIVRVNALLDASSKPA